MVNLNLNINEDDMTSLLDTLENIVKQVKDHIENDVHQDKISFNAWGEEDGETGNMNKLCATCTIEQSNT